MTPADFPQVQALPVREKLFLVDELWQSIGESTEEVEVSEAAKSELDSRWERFERDPSLALTVEQFGALVNAKRG